MTPKILIHEELCVRCGACVMLCTGGVFAESKAGVDVVAAEECWLCGHCVAVCPADAITHSAYGLDQCPTLDPARLLSFDALETVFRERRSLRVFDDRPVPRQLVRELVDVARWVPSASNEQPVDWLAFDDPDRIAALSAETVAVLAQTARLLRNPLLRPILILAVGAGKVRAGLESAESFEHLAQKHALGEDPIFRHAPVVLVAHVPDGDYFGRDDAVYATYNLMLAAQRLGLGTCQIGYAQIALDRSQEMRNNLGLPQGRKAEVILTLGYPVRGFRRVVPRRRPDLIWNGVSH